jgi:hypothetical protein
MHEYEIRLLSAGHTIAIIEEMHLSDHGAITSARKYADGNRFEVWRGDDCIYRTGDSPRMSKTGNPLSPQSHYYR